jgi:hypothetical protein
MQQQLVYWRHSWQPQLHTRVLLLLRLGPTACWRCAWRRLTCGSSWVVSQVSTGQKKGLSNLPGVSGSCNSRGMTVEGPG